jgi:trimeric autotransporter adhesin
MKTKNCILSFILGLMLMPSFLFGQGILISSNAYVIADSGYAIVKGNMANSGTLKLQTGIFTMSGNYTNSGTYTQGTGNIVFNGQSEALLDNGFGTMFTNVFFNGNGGAGNPAVISSGNFSVSSTGILNMVNATSLNANGHLTLNSDANSSATVAAIPAAASITGNVNAQRFVNGGAGYRGYRLLSSPVYAATVNANKVYSINYLKNTIILTGTNTNITGGFDNTSAVNPTVYLYRENMIPSYSSFTNSNFIGINNILTSPTYGMNDATYPTANIPVGNGFLCFFRGDRSFATYAAETTAAYVPQPATLGASGTLNQGRVTVADWFSPLSSNLSFTPASPLTVKGFNLVGNPYASSIDWETYSSTTPASGIYGPSVTPTIYELNPLTHNYDIYQKGGAFTNNGTNIIVSGQGFFVNVTCACAQLVFNEWAKVNTQNTGLNLFMGKPDNQSADSQYLRLQMAKDSINTDDILIRFNKGVKSEFDEIADAPYKIGSGAVSLSSLSSDQVSLAINVQPLPNQSEKIRLNISATTDGFYKLNMKQLMGIPQLFDVWLMDAYKKDSLDMRHNPSYSFNVSKNDTSSFGANRFSLVIRQNPAYAYRLLNFTAAKVPGVSQVQVVWEAENEANYTNFTVEHSTDGGKTFNVLGEEKAAASGTYSLLDRKPIAGLNLYRLKQEDFNDVITYSKVVQVQYSDMSNNHLVANNISVYPNPATSTINIAISTDAVTKHAYTYRIANSLGLIVKQVTSQQANWQPNISDLMPGSYIIKVLSTTDNSLIGNSKFIKL